MLIVWKFFAGKNHTVVVFENASQPAHMFRICATIPVLANGIHMQMRCVCVVALLCTRLGYSHLNARKTRVWVSMCAMAYKLIVSGDRAIKKAHTFYGLSPPSTILPLSEVRAKLRPFGWNRAHMLCESIECLLCPTIGNTV